MSQENVALVRRGYEAFNRGDLDGMFAEAAPAFEYLATGVVPGAGGVYHGPEEFRRFLERWWGEFDESRTDVHELTAAGDRVLASLTFRGRGRQNGAEANWSLWQLWTLRDGKFVRGQGFTSREAALDAVGLRE
jgi:ketosteroid isomerase-like protein